MVMKIIFIWNDISPQCILIRQRYALKLAIVVFTLKPSFS